MFCFCWLFMGGNLLMQRYGLDGTVRASFAVYNTLEEVDVLLEALRKLAR